MFRRHSICKRWKFDKGRKEKLYARLNRIFDLESVNAGKDPGFTLAFRATSLSGHYMKAHWLLICSALVCAGMAVAQSTPGVKTAGIRPADSPRAQAIQLLEEASALGGSLPPDSQAGLYFALGRTYASFDKAKAKEAYEIAYQNMRAGIASQTAHPELVGFLAGDLIMSTVEIAPQTVEQSLPDGWFRDLALGSLIKQYAQQKQWNRAIELLLMMESDGEMTYPARDLLMVLSRQDDRDRVFTAVLIAYSKTKHRQVGTGAPEDLGTLVVRFWRKLSPALVHQAIDELLKQAKDGDSIVMKSPQGTVTFTSYQFRLFQVFSALKAIDPEEADALVKDEKETAALMAKYPQGQLSADPSLRDTPLKDGEQRQTTYMYVRDAGAVAPAAARMDDDRAVENLIASTSNDLDSAIANAARLPDRLRLRALVGIAQAAALQRASAAKSALREALKLEQDRDWRVWKQAAEIAIQIHELDLADAALKAGMKAARRSYNEDSDSDNPNIALKLYWPSVRAYRELIAVQAKVSPNAALATVRGLPDEEVSALEKVMLAAAELHAPFPETSPMVAKKRDVERQGSLQ